MGKKNWDCTDSKDLSHVCFKVPVIMQILFYIASHLREPLTYLKYPFSEISN